LKLSTTGKAWLGIIGGGLAYEAWALANKAKDDTLSEEFWRAAYRRPLIPFLFGMLAGHFVWQSDKLYEFEVKTDDGKVKTTRKVEVSGKDRRNERKKDE
jgi:hypothetical protein